MNKYAYAINACTKRLEMLYRILECGCSNPKEVENEIAALERDLEKLIRRAADEKK